MRINFNLTLNKFTYMHVKNAIVSSKSLIIKFKDLGIINPNSEVLKTNNNNTVNFRTANAILRNS